MSGVQKEWTIQEARRSSNGLLTLHPKKIDLALDRIQRLLDDLGNPEKKLAPVIHVAGTNGKGSVCAYLRAMLEAQGASRPRPHLAASGALP